MKVVVATRNAGKLQELRKLLPTEFELLTLDDINQPSPDETGSTFLENAQLKSRAIVELGYAAIADDSGLVVDALDGEPGVRSARYAGDGASDEQNNLKLVQELASRTSNGERSARFVSAVVLAFPDGTEFDACGEVHGRIVDEPRGVNGFGYDPHFEISDPDASDFNGRTMAELSLDEKSHISHRARAYRALQSTIEQSRAGIEWPTKHRDRLN